MKFHFNKYERVAGLFVIIAVVGFVASMLSVAIKQGWFDAKIEFVTSFESADGVHPGTLVQIAGLKAGSVESVELTTDNKIIVHFYVLEKYENKVRNDSVASLMRPFVIGERVLDVSPGTASAEALAVGSHVPSVESTDLITMMSGRQIGVYLSSMTDMLGNLRNLAEAFLNKERTASMIEMMDHIDPLIKNLTVMSVEVTKLSRQANKDERLGSVLAQLAVTTKELNGLLPQIHERAPKMADDMSTLVTNLAELTTEFKVVIPAITTIAPDLPRVSKRAVEALDEAVILMKAMEKSFLVRSNVKEVREQEQAESQEKQIDKRAPATK